jgi:hypothetical protein
MIFIGVLFFFLGVLYAATKVKEPFGFSNGTLIQLSTSHVPTAEDEELSEEYRKQVKQDLINMTGSA